ncbi:MAG: hypothetical protein ACRD3I_10700 [Terriglobales bacterium]
MNWVLLVIAWSVFAVGETGADRSVEKTLASRAQFCDGAAQTGAAGDRLAQQEACCKGQKGVCGCRAGKIVCCDGKFSEGCTCNRDDGPGSPT